MEPVPEEIFSVGGPGIAAGKTDNPTTPLDETMKRESGNPYLEARKEYEDRYGSVIKAAARWRQISILMAFLCLAFGAMMIWLASQNKVVPYIVQVDEHGYSVAIKSAMEGAATDQRVVIAQLARAIMDFRTVITDGKAQKKLIDSVYACIARDSAAATTVGIYYRDNNPYTLVKEKKQARQVTIRNVVPYESSGGKGKSWLVLWTENTTADGRIVETAQWRAIVQIVISPVRDLESVIVNPLGIYITEISIARDIA